MHAATRAQLQSDFDLKEQVFREVSARLAEKGRLSLLPGSKSDWPDAQDHAEYLAASKNYNAASELLSQHCRSFRT